MGLRLAQQHPCPLQPRFGRSRGRPWSQRKKLVWWDAEKQRWDGLDHPDFERNKPPDYQPPPGATGMAAIAGTQPFTMKADGVGWLYSPGVKEIGRASCRGRV